MKDNESPCKQQSNNFVWTEFTEDSIHELVPDEKYFVTDGYDIRICFYNELYQEFYDDDTGIAWGSVTHYAKLPRFP